MSAGEVETILRRPGPLPGVIPNYTGLGLNNLVATIEESLAAPASLHPPIPADYLDAEVLRGVRRIVILVMDGLGYLQLERESRAGHVPNLKGLIQEGPYMPISTVLPSTTAAALSTLCTGLTPQEHGVMGYRLYLREYGLIANMIALAPISGRGSLRELGVEPDDQIPGTNVFERLRASGAASYVLTRLRFVGSPFSRMIHRGAEYAGYSGTGDMFVRLRRLLAGTEGKKAFIFVYADPIDVIGHLFGVGTEEHSSQLAALDFSLGFDFLERFKSPDTLFLITADHGMVDTTEDSLVDLHRHPKLLEDLYVPPTGDSRLPYFHVQGPRAGHFETYVAKHLGDKGDLMASPEAMELGLFGRNPPRSESRERVGDYILFPRANHAFTYHHAQEETRLIGRHGGLAPEEMLVPLLAHRFG